MKILKNGKIGHASNQAQSAKAPVAMCINQFGVRQGSAAQIEVKFCDIGHIVHVQQVDLLKDVVGVVEWPSCCGETGELFNEATVLPEQTPNFILKIVWISQSGTS